MSTLTSNVRVLVVGIGGLGCPLLLALSGDSRLIFVLADDDVVDESNLHRQVLFNDADVGRDKALSAAEQLARLGVARERVEIVGSRFVPENARGLARSVDLLVEGADNYATKFLVADAAFLERKPVVHGAAVAWNATAWSVASHGAPCYRCLFEDVPVGETQNCSSVGVMGPVVGFGAALMADLALRQAFGTPRLGELLCYEGTRDRLRSVQVPPRASCPLCGPRPQITQIDAARYLGPSCFA
jgi:molybdopterin/thiamine biosynthesis adenylyltransferase